MHDYYYFFITFTYEFRPFTQYFVEAPLVVITSSSLLGYNATSLAHLYLGSFSLLCSSSQALSGWMGSVAAQLFFRSFQRCYISFKSGLWLGHSRIFRDLSRSHSCVEVLVVPNFFHLKMMEITVFLGTFNEAEMFWYPFADLCLDTILSRSSTNNSFNLMAWFLLWHALSTVGLSKSCPINWIYHR